MEIQTNIPLAPYTTFGIGGAAGWFVEARSEGEIVDAAAWARDRRVPFFVLGGGSNLLIADKGFDGLVLRIALRGVTVTDSGESDHPAQKSFRAAAGEPWEQFVEQTLAAGCAGLECLAGIPGTVGGTPVQNVGAYGQEVASVIDRVRAYDLEARGFVEFSADECCFSYRRSRFNSADSGRFIVTRVDYRLTPGGRPAVHYPELARAVAAAYPGNPSPSPAEVAAVVLELRRRKGMLLVEGDADCRSAGSFFKNPIVPAEFIQESAVCSAAPHFPAGTSTEGGELVKIPAAWLIERAGSPKGFALGAAGISSRHTLALINRGGATADEVLALAGRIAGAVEERFGIRLEMEPVRVGF